MAAIQLPPDLKAMADLIQEQALPYTYTTLMRMDGLPAACFDLLDNIVHVVHKNNLFLATDKIPGIPMDYIGMGDLRMCIRI